MAELKYGQRTSTSNTISTLSWVGKTGSLQVFSEWHHTNSVVCMLHPYNPIFQVSIMTLSNYVNLALSGTFYLIWLQLWIIDGANYSELSSDFLE